MGSVLYLDNLPSDSSLNDIFSKFGKYGTIEKVKFLKQYNNESTEGYFAGIALVQFKDKKSVSECCNDTQPIIISGRVIHKFQSPISINNRISTSIFLFFKCIGETAEGIMKKLEFYSPINCQILHPVGFKRDGMAIVQFNSDRDKETILSRENQVKNENQYILCRPQYDFELLSFEDEETFPAITVTPPTSLYADPLQFPRYYDFEIKYHEQSFKVNTFLASSLSNKISLQLQNNVPISSYTCNVSMKGPFNLICQTLMGQEIPITSDNVIFFLLCAKDLEISQLTEACMEFITDMSDTDLLFRFATDLCLNGLDYTAHVNYISDHFDLLKDNPAFKSLPLQIVYDVLAQLPAEKTDTSIFATWLLSFVGENSEARVKLVKFLPFSKIDASNIRNILSRTGVNMNALKEPLIKIVDSGFEGFEDNSKDTYKCSYTQENKTHGIFAELSKRYGKKASEIVTVNGTSDIASIVDPTSRRAWVSPSIPNMWIMFDLDPGKGQDQPCRKLLLRHYTLKTASSGEVCHLKSWILEGANDVNSQWTCLHDQAECSTLRSSGKISTFQSVASGNKPFRYIRLRMTGKNWDKSESLCLQSIEFYGEIYFGDETEKKECFRYENNGKDWCGFFDWLRRKSLGNPALNKEIAIHTAANPAYICDSCWNGYWRSPNLPNSNIEFILPEMTQICIESYNLKTCKECGKDYPQNWVIEGSEDGKRWTVIDQRTNVDTLKKADTICNFPCKMSQRYSFIRIKQNGKNGNGQDTFYLSNVEFFGELFISG